MCVSMGGSGCWGDCGGRAAGRGITCWGRGRCCACLLVMLRAQTSLRRSASPGASLAPAPASQAARLLDCRQLREHVGRAVAKRQQRRARNGGRQAQPVCDVLQRGAEEALRGGEEQRKREEQQAEQQQHGGPAPGGEGCRVWWVRRGVGGTLLVGGNVVVVVMSCTDAQGVRLWGRAACGLARRIGRIRRPRHHAGGKKHSWTSR